jgi:hypothetical protein
MPAPSQLNKELQMFKIFDAPVDPFAQVKLLAIMPIETMQLVFGMERSAIARVESETQNNGVCQLFFRRPIPGFGTKVIVQAASAA